MIGIVLATLSAISKTGRNTVSKVTVHTTDHFVTSWATRTFALIAIIPAAILFGIENFQSIFLLSIIQGILVGGATLLYAKALELSDLSIVVPISSFSPVFLVITGFLILGEQPNIGGLIGIITIALGVYSLNINEVSTSIFKPIKSIWADKGAQLALGVTLIYSITAVIGKIGVERSSPVTWSLSIYIVMAVFLSVVMFFKSNELKEKVSSNYKALIIVGLFTGLGFIFQATAYEYTLVVFVVSIKKTHMIFSVLIGYLYFDEVNIRSRLFGASLVFSGSVFIVISEFIF